MEREMKTKTALPETYFIPIHEMLKLYEKEKSIHKEMVKKVGIEVPYRKKITRFTYEMPINDIIKLYKKNKKNYWLL